MMKTSLLTSVAMISGPLLVSCQISSDHVVETRHEIKPIEINVNVRVDRELDRFFEDLDEASTTVAASSTTSP